MARQQIRPLRRGWTTGACAAAAARAAFTALLSGRFPDPVAIRLPRGATASFPLALAGLGEGRARAGIVKDAGDDPDVTHGALVVASIAWAAPGSGIRFAAGEGVGTVTRAGLPLAVGEPAINPAPRAMISDALLEAAEENGGPPPDVTVTISIPGGERLAEKTMNARLGIKGGLSILGTTGIVVPYSCSSWIHSIRRGIDVARAAGLDHIAARPDDHGDISTCHRRSRPCRSARSREDRRGAARPAPRWHRSTRRYGRDRRRGRHRSRAGSSESMTNMNTGRQSRSSPGSTGRRQFRAVRSWFFRRGARRRVSRS